MSNYIYNPDSGELYHYGVKGMKWGHRKKDPYAARRVRGHAGPGHYVGNKRKIEGYKRDLERLDRGEHLSIGATKKRQAAYDARDRKYLEKGIANAEAREAHKQAAKVKLKNAATNVKNTAAKGVDAAIAFDDRINKTMNDRTVSKGKRVAAAAIKTIGTNRLTTLVSSTAYEAGMPVVGAIIGVYGTVKTVQYGLDTVKVAAS